MIRNKKLETIATALKKHDLLKLGASFTLQDLEITDTAVRAATSPLINRGYIVRHAHGYGGKFAVYAVTEKLLHYCKVYLSQLLVDPASSKAPTLPKKNHVTSTEIGEAFIALIASLRKEIHRRDDIIKEKDATIRGMRAEHHRQIKELRADLATVRDQFIEKNAPSTFPLSELSSVRSLTATQREQKGE